jgi:carboxymethylenebutenolidase
VAELETGPHEVEVEQVVLTGSDRVQVDAVHARPDGMPTSGVVLHPDVFGLRPLFDDLCRRIATHGFAVIAPEPFVRAPADVRAAEGPDARMGFAKELEDDLQLGDLEIAADYLVVHDDVHSVAALGFCMGGMQVLKVAARGRFDKAVAIYGMIRPSPAWMNDKTTSPLDTAADVCPTLAIFAGRDPLTPPEDIDALRAAWAERPDCEIVVYPEAEHGFVHAPERPAHRAADAADVWKRVLAFLQN